MSRQQNPIGGWDGLSCDHGLDPDNHRAIACLQHKNLYGRHWAEMIFWGHSGRRLLSHLPEYDACRHGKHVHSYRNVYSARCGQVQGEDTWRQGGLGHTGHNIEGNSETHARGTGRRDKRGESAGQG